MIAAAAKNGFGSDDRRRIIDRRTGKRRSLRERRESQRRSARRLVTWERRKRRDRRAAQRRMIAERRAGVPRRTSDRARTPPVDYTPDQTADIRQQVLLAQETVTCPLCQGKIDVEAPINIRGARVWEVFCIPCHRRVMIRDETGLRVFVIDPDGQSRALMSALVREAGHAAIEAKDVAAALRAFDDRAPDLVIVDVQLVGGDGLEFVRRIRREHPSARIITMAGQRRHGAPDPLAAAKRLGASGILRKPFDPRAVLQLVRQTLKP